jgi:hypothetical protein
MVNFLSDPKDTRIAPQFNREPHLRCKLPSRASEVATRAYRANPKGLYCPSFGPSL